MPFTFPEVLYMIIKVHAKFAKIRRKDRKGMIKHNLLCVLCDLILRSLREKYILI